MNAGLAAEILSGLITKVELDHPIRLTDSQKDALTFAYSAVQNLANSEEKQEDA